MFRYILFVMLILGAANPVRADNWAEKLFEETSFDFGSVPYGQTPMHSFRIVNNTKSPVHIAQVRVSCSDIVSIQIPKYDLAPGEETPIIVRMGRLRFVGQRTQAIHVQFDAPKIEEVKLKVQATYRKELTFYPNDLDFKKIKRGTTPTEQMVVGFFGNPKVHVTDATCDSKFIEPKLKELHRDGVEVRYQVSATLRADIPEGKWHTDVWLTTNAPSMPRVRVPVVVEVEPAR
jgi:hypothetical protein